MWSATKAAICAVIVPRVSPGKVRLKLRPSTGETRWPAITAWTLFAGIRMSRPWTRPGSSSRISSPIAICPSFVAVIAGFEHHGRPAAVLDHGERHARHAPGVIVRRVRDHQEPDLLSGAVEIDGGEGRGRPDGGGLSHG